MVNIDITRLSSKGQVIIPLEIRRGLKKGDKLIAIRNNDQIILKKLNSINKNFQEDLEFAKRTEEAWKQIEKGEFISVDSENLFEEMNKW